MLKILKRKAARNGVKRLREYFEGDFRKDAKMWDAAKRSAVETSPLVARFEPEAAEELPGWKPLIKGDFLEQLSVLRPKARGSVIAYELALAPPKSFTLAALAGEYLNTRLLRIHSKAAAEAYRLVAGFFMTRREENGRKFLEPVRT